MSYYDDVLAFRKKHELVIGEEPRLLTISEYIQMARFIGEEILEFETAHETASVVDAADAIVDLVYVIIGIAIKMGLPFNKIWAAVHNANMTGKIKVENASQSKRGMADDVIKGPDFVSPEAEIAKILGVYYEK